ncbi:hypothetical protein HZI31_06645 [Serratia fonticola]|uniref:tail fiber/spike domain-containing protein n=1 Tax=Serratia fonticola TaxID=47917 RepID=UPI0015C62841|nr:hypothetical protein [Serratia fonticola]NYA42984.1 hypothetical protein [Serratia fonticola]
MALTNNASAALSATVAENAAAEAKSYAIKASQAEDFSNKAQASAESAAASAISSQNSAVAAEEAMNIALEQTIATIRVPDGEALSVLPVANERKGKFPGFDPVTGDVQLIDISSTDAASLALSLASTEGSALVGTPSGTVEERFSSIELGLDGKASNDVVATKISGDVTFATGGTLFSEKDFIYNSENFSWYFWSGSFSGSGKVVPPGATPEDTGGVGPSKWVNIGDAALRGDLAKPTGAAMIGGLGYMTASAYGFTGVGNETALATQFLNYCSTRKITAVIDKDVDWDGLIYSNSVSITGNNLVKGFVKFWGDISPSRTNTVITGTAGDYTTYPAGATVINGGFSSYAPGDKVIIELADDANFNGAQNQIGVMFCTVTAASAGSITISPALRFPFDKMKVSKTTFSTLSGTQARGTYSFSGDFSFLTPGQLARFENINGTDCVDGTTRYFEYCRVKSCSTTSLILMDALEYTHVDPVVSSGNFTSNIKLFNANFEIVQMRALLYSTMTNCRLTRSINDYLYNCNVIGNTVLGASPNIMNITYGRNTVVYANTVSGATGVTDNAAFKMMSPISCIVSGIVAEDYGVASGVQSINGIYVDYAFTPYQNWGSRLNINNCVAGKQKGGLGVWLDGIRDSQISNLSAEAHIRLYEMDDCKVTGIRAGKVVFFRNCTRSKFKDLDALALQILGPIDCEHDGVITRGGAVDNANRCVSFGGSSSRPIAINNTLRNYTNLSTTATDTTLFYGNVNGLYVDGLTDKAGLTASITNSGSNITLPVSIQNVRTNNTVSIGSHSSVVNNLCDIGVGVGTAAWDRRRIIINDHYIFPSGESLRIKKGAPTSSSDGGILMNRVSAPSAKTSPGVPGQMGIDGTYLYIYRSNEWERIQLSGEPW